MSTIYLNEVCKLKANQAEKQSSKYFCKPIPILSRIHLCNVAKITPDESLRLEVIRGKFF